MDDLLREFLTESSESLLGLEQEIVELERRPKDKDLLGSIFRTIHTIKGTCGFLDLTRLEGIAHSAENVLGRLRDGEISVSDDVIGDVLSAVDIIKDILEGLEETEEEPQGDDSLAIRRLDAWLENDDDARDLAALDAMFQAARDRSAAGEPPGATNVPQTTGSEEGSDETAPAPDAQSSSADDAASPAGAQSPSAGTTGASNGGPSRGRAGKGEGDNDKRAVAEASLRVDVEVLDRLMNLAGELVLARNQLNQLAQREEHWAFNAPVQQLNRVTTDLQEAVMKTRMQPVGNAWGKLPRLIRDLANAGGKQIDLLMVGGETELDRQILQAIKDPLTHMVRNSADHGIEMPDVRAAQGKNPQGQVVLEAFHEGGHIVIEIRDDGKGLNVEAIRRKAVERGLVDEDVAAGMPAHRVFEFIFEAGFSTATKVTSVSGRGVGMDVVRRNIERIGGTIEVSSGVGDGTTMRIKIPLTLAIMSALIVGAGGQTFAIPQIAVLELVRVGAENARLVETVNGSRFYRLREDLLPLVRLADVLGLEEASESIEDMGSIIVCQVGHLRFGLVANEILDTHEIVVKPVGRRVKGIREYAGTTILGDGSVIMILDVPGIALEQELQARTTSRDEDQQDHVEETYTGQGTSLLLFEAGAEAPKAVPLALVSRLEEFPVDTIERADGHWVVQYRGQLLPIVGADPEMDMLSLDPRPVVVVSDGDLPIGLAVDAISDIVQEELKVEVHSATPGILGTAVVAGRATELVDIDHHVGQAHRGWRSGLTGNEGARVLVVDDSPFFLNLLTPVLRAEGYRVSVSHDGQHALTRLNRGERFDLVVSDIDMPQVDGFQLARFVRADGRWEGVPMVALTSRDSDADRATGIEAGFDRYLKKFDQEAVLDAIREVLGTVSESEEVLV